MGIFGGKADRCWVLVVELISARMLMYAACVEMLAGDFVMDPLLWGAGVAAYMSLLYCII